MTPEIVNAADITPTTMPVPTAPAAAVSAETGAAGSTPAAPAPSLDAGKVDRAGVVFDPARHIDRTNKVTGRWMPRGGRKAKVPAPLAGTSGAPAPAASNAPKVESFIPSTPPPPPPSDEPSPSPAAAEPPPPDNSEDAAECAAQALQFAAGIALDANEETTCTPAEHKGMVRAFAAYIRAKGWQATAGVATLLVVVAYLLRVFRKEKPRATVKRWFYGADPTTTAKNVTPEDKKPAPPAAPPSPPPGSAADVIELYRQNPAT